MSSMGLWVWMRVGLLRSGLWGRGVGSGAETRGRCSDGRAPWWGQPLGGEKLSVYRFEGIVTSQCCIDHSFATSLRLLAAATRYGRRLSHTNTFYMPTIKHLGHIISGRTMDQLKIGAVKQGAKGRPKEKGLVEGFRTSTVSLQEGKPPPLEEHIVNRDPKRACPGKPKQTISVSGGDPLYKKG